MFQKWKKGVELAEISILLPFVQLTLKPMGADSPGSGIVELKNNGNQLDLRIASKAAYDHAFVENNFIERKTYYRLVTEVVASDDGDDLRHHSLKWESWRALEGKVTLYQGDILWLTTVLNNSAGRVLYEIPVTMGYLPFARKLPCLVTTHKKNSRQFDYGEKGTDTTQGTKIDLWHADMVCVLHCLCRVPKSVTNSKDIQFSPFPNSPSAQLTQPAKNAILPWPTEKATAGAQFLQKEMYQYFSQHLKTEFDYTELMRLP
jgi:hypothetical protein